MTYSTGVVTFHYLYIAYILGIVLECLPQVNVNIITEERDLCFKTRWPIHTDNWSVVYIHSVTKDTAAIIAPLTVSPEIKGEN